MVQFKYEIEQQIGICGGDIMQNTQIEKAIPWNPWHGCNVTAHEK